MDFEYKDKVYQFILTYTVINGEHKVNCDVDKEYAGTRATEARKMLAVEKFLMQAKKLSETVAFNKTVSAEEYFKSNKPE